MGLPQGMSVKFARGHQVGDPWSRAKLPLGFEWTCAGVHHTRVNIKSAIAMAEEITSCSTAILAAESILQIVLRIIGIFTSRYARTFYEKMVAWHSSKVEAWNLTDKTFKTSQFNESSLFICRHKLNTVVQEHNCSGKKRQTNGRFVDEALKQAALNI